MQGLPFKGIVNKMPKKNSLKVYVEGGYYHIYNRGVEKRKIFEDNRDHKVFLNNLKESLSPPPKPEDVKITFTLQGLPFKGVPRLPKNFYKEIDLLAYCLMPNHFHLLIKQTNSGSMQSFMSSICTRYSMYFNKKYSRIGRLFQGPYKAVLVTEEPYLLHLSRYIHLNPSEYKDNLTLAYSSYADYLGKRNTVWVKPDMVLSFFNQTTIPELEKFNSYKDFVEKYKKDISKIFGELTLD